MAASAKVLPAYTPVMRLSLSTRSTIRDTVRSVVGPDATMRLFGSDSATGQNPHIRGTAASSVRV